MARRLDKWEAQHRRNVAMYERMIDDIYKEAVREAASLSIPLTGIFSPDKPFSFADYPLTRNRVNNLLESLKNGMETAIVNGVRSEWTLANNKHNELCRRVFGDNVGKLTDEQYRRYYSNNDKARDAFIARKTAGLNLSDRVWNYTDQFKTEIEMGLDLGLRDGLSADEMSRTLRQYLKYPDKLFRRVRDEHGNLHISKRAAAFHPGQGVYRSSYKNARRLTATETNIAYRTADYVRHQQLDFVVGIEVHLSGNHTLNGKPFEDICDELAGRYPKDFKFTGWHPLCRCYTTTILKTPEEMAEDDRRIMAGEEPMPSEESGNYVPDVPEGFGKWIDGNTERIERAKSLPYFMRDNEKYIKPLTITPQARAGADEAQKFNAEMMRAADVPQAPKARTREEILAAAQERHAARTQEEIDEIKQRWAISRNNTEIGKALNIKKGKGMTFDEADESRCNPNYLLHNAYDLGYYHNCQTCTMTYELRRRGFDVEALANPVAKGYKSYTEMDVFYDANKIEWTDRFLTKDGKKVDYEWSFNETLKDTNASKLGFIENKTAEKGRYEIYCSWKGGNAHVFILERQENGDLLWFDPQTGRSGGTFTDSLKRMKRDRIGILRIDDKLINNQFLSRFQKSRATPKSS